MIDSHCHLADKQFSRDLPDVIARAHASQVSVMVCIADDLEEAKRCQRIAQDYESIFFTAGIHPHHATTFDGQSLDAIRSLCSHEKCKAIGEIGLDYHYMRSPKDTQQSVFEKQLVLAKELTLPAIVHCRDAVEDVWTIVHHVRPEKLQLHCCTEKWEDVKRFVDAGFMLSFTGIATYPKSDAIRTTIKHCPLAQMMIETDAPYLAPVPHRGKRNEPAFVVEVAKCIATIKGVSLAEVDAATAVNAKNFFAIS